jgi:hypothetical protein
VSRAPAGAIAVGAALAMIVYAGMRAEQVLFHPAVDQATVLFTAHSGYAWRAWIAAFAGALGAACWAMARVSPATTARSCLASLSIATCCLVLQAVLCP